MVKTDDEVDRIECLMPFYAGFTHINLKNHLQLNQWEESFCLMWGPLLLFGSHLLQVLSLICVCLIVVPLVFPVTAFLCGLIVGGSLLLSIAGKRLKKKTHKSVSEGLLNSAQRVSRRAVRISLVSLFISFLLYGILRLHISVCYIRDLDKELEPVREGFRSAAPQGKQN